MSKSVYEFVLPHAFPQQADCHIAITQCDVYSENVRILVIPSMYCKRLSRIFALRTNNQSY